MADVMKRRGLRRVLVVAIAGIGAAAACAFPDVSFVPDLSSEAGQGDERTEAAPGDSGNGGDAGVDSGGDGSDVDPNGRDADASKYDPDAATKVDASGCTTCDCDGDNFNQKDGASCTGGPGAVFDCDDTDKFINPNTGFVEATSWPSSYKVTFDWNCDGVVTKKLAYNVTCTGLADGACLAKEGFLSDIGCGQSGPYVVCQAGGVANLSCVNGPITTKTQACKQPAGSDDGDGGLASPRTDGGLEDHDGADGDTSTKPVAPLCGAFSPTATAVSLPSSSIASLNQIGGRGNCVAGSTGDPWWTTMDLDGDGKLDLVLTSACGDPTVGISKWEMFRCVP